VDALGINLSDVGMCLFAIANLPLSSEIHLEFLPPHGKERIRVCATVRHRAFYLYGVEFLVDSEPLDGGWAEVGSVQQPAESE
jgi:hypothetical protein